MQYQIEFFANTIGNSEGIKRNALLEYNFHNVSLWRTTETGEVWCVQAEPQENKPRSKQKAPTVSWWGAIAKYSQCEVRSLCVCVEPAPECIRTYCDKGQTGQAEDVQEDSSSTHDPEPAILQLAEQEFMDCGNVICWQHQLNAFAPWQGTEHDGAKRKAPEPAEDVSESSRPGAPLPDVRASTTPNVDTQIQMSEDPMVAEGVLQLHLHHLLLSPSQLESCVLMNDAVQMAYPCLQPWSRLDAARIPETTEGFLRPRACWLHTASNPPRLRKGSGGASRGRGTKGGEAVL